MSGDLTDFIIVMITVFVVSLGMLWKQQARARKQSVPITPAIWGDRGTHY